MLRMARRPRLELPGVPLHVIQRGNNRTPCFLADGDRRLYLRCLKDAAARHRCDIHAYVLMTNHVHLLVTASVVGAVASMMQDVGRRYVRLFNKIHQRSGTLWEGRYKSSLIDSEAYLLACHRYIELNPVRAGLVQHPLQFPWSSCAHYALGTRNPLITRHPLFDEMARQQGDFLEHLGNEMSPDVVGLIRVAANKGWALGSDSFLDRIEGLLGRSVRPPKRGRPLKREDEADRQGSEMLI
jgi:putative transposase